MLNHPVAAPITFLAGLALLLAGQVASQAELAMAASLLGGALLIVVAIRALAQLGGLHDTQAHLDGGETLLVESQDVLAETRLLLARWQRGSYRARLTNKRVLLSLKVWRINTSRDVTIAILEPGRPASVSRIEIISGDAGPAAVQPRPSPGRVVLTPAHRRGTRWTLHVSDVEEWRAALEQHHRELLAPTAEQPLQAY